MAVFVIAEAGVNHNGDISLAKKLIDIAAESGADAVKFQTFKAEKVASSLVEKAAYQKETTNPDESHLEMLKKLELSYNAHEELISYCKERGIMFMSTPFDIDSARFLRDLGLDIFKIPSGEITNYFLLKEIGSYEAGVILSTGMAYMDEIKAAIDLLITSGTKKDNITVLHCNTEYPTPFSDANLRAMVSIRNELGVRVGYSDHTLGIEAAIAAVALGAEVIEKHFTLDKNLPGPDHRASLEPDELKSMVSAIRNIEQALGNGIKEPSKSEVKNISVARKSLIASKDIRKGEVFTEGNVTALRPGTGISPMLWPEVRGRKAIRDFKKGELIEIDW